jgi:putative membrane protein
MLWVKAFHIIFMVTWFAGLFYLPRLFVYHTDTADVPGRERFKVMERKLYRAIMTPGAVITVICGGWLIQMQGMIWLRASGWMHIKLVLVAVLVVYHVYLGRLCKAFAEDRNRHGHVFYRCLNEFPALILIAVVLLAVLKPVW